MAFLGMQRTLADFFELGGIGVHSGRPCSVLCRPADADKGLMLVRTDLSTLVEIPVRPENLSPSDRCTSLWSGKVGVHTVEHLLASLLWSGVDNARIEVFGEEIPILDGSAKEVVDVIGRVGTREQGVPRRHLVLSEPVWVMQEECFLLALPADGLTVDCVIRFDHPLIRVQHLSLNVTEQSFAAGIASARTFGFLKDREALQARGLALGASLNNTVVLTDEGLASGALRFEDEFVRHKILDLLGDLAVLGRRPGARIIAVRPSHGINGLLVRKLASHAG